MSRLSRLAPAFLTLALAGCPYVSKIVVPSVDTGNPVHYDMVYDVAASSYAGVGSVEISDPNAVYAAVASSFDEGGVRQVTMEYDVNLRCRTSSGRPYNAYPVDQMELTERQRGSVGDTVDNGLYTWKGFRAADHIACPASYPHLTSVTFSWSTESVDFHGNTTSSRGEIRYVP